MKKTSEILINGVSLEDILVLHKKWLLCASDGIRADLRYADLSNANLCGANLRNANLYDANLCGANLRNANLIRANLRGADLSYANLSDADLSDANLRGADLRGADLRGADLNGADLNGVRVNSGTAFFAISCPEEGSFIGWKKCAKNTLVKLLITENAKRSSATSLKCRCSEAVVLAIYDSNDKEIEKANSIYAAHFVYEVGKTVKVDNFDDDRWNECSSGIHFFMNKEIARQYK